MPLIIKPRLRSIALLASCSTLAGCHAAPPPVTREVLVGSYVYKSEDPEGKATDHNLDQLALQSDGKYDLVQGGSTKARTRTVGTWTIWNGGNDGPTVLLDHSGYPIEIKKNEVRLLIDLDVGIWWVKAK